jgi:hypothetical protein
MKTLIILVAFFPMLSPVTWANPLCTVDVTDISRLSDQYPDVLEKFEDGLKKIGCEPMQQGNAKYSLTVHYGWDYCNEGRSPVENDAILLFGAEQWLETSIATLDQNGKWQFLEAKTVSGHTRGLLHKASSVEAFTARGFSKQMPEVLTLIEKNEEVSK